MINNKIVMNDTLWIGVYPGLTDAVPYYVCDQPSTFNHQLYFVVEKIEAFFDMNF